MNNKHYQKRKMYAEYYRKWMQRTHLSNTYDMKHKIPADFYPDDSCFTNHEMIHLGIGETYEYLGAKDDADEFIDITNYVLQHEEFHCRYTVSSVYQQAIQKSVENIIEYGATKLEGHTIRFRKDTDYLDYVDSKRTDGIRINVKMINKIVAGIENSLEDGRIERIGSGKYPGFALLRVKFRGRTWNTEHKYKPWTEIENSPADKLQILMSYILSMATCQLYPKGFFIAYAGTPMLDMANDLMPNIARAYMAPRSNKLATETMKICDKLKDLIFEVCTSPVTADQKALEELLKELITAMVNSMPDTGLAQTDEEEDTDQNMNSTFGNSDLTVTLDDETYDKLMKNSKKSDGGSGINIRREHPLEEENNSNEENSKNSKNGNKEDENATEKFNTDEQNNSSGNGQSGNKGSNSDQMDKKENSGSMSTSEESTDNESNGDVKGEGSDDSNEETAQENVANNNEKDDFTEPNDSSSKSNKSANNALKTEKHEGYTDSTGSENNSDLLKKHSAQEMKEIEKQIKEAEKKLKEESQSISDMVSRTHSNDRREAAGAKEVKDTDKPIRSEEMRDICDFIEVKRDYEVDRNLPVDVEARGKVLRRKNRQYFKGLSTPNITYLDSGSVDPSRLYSLSFGDSNVFRKIGKDKHFDGCVYVLIDNSGSMDCRDKRGVSKRTEACKAAAVIEEGFKGFLPMKIVAFDEYGTVQHQVIKGWNESLRKNCCWNFCEYENTGYGNADGFDIQIATRELMKRSERKKLLIVLSDGMPSEATPGYTKGAIEAARARGIQVSGIYFENDKIGHEAEQFKKMYQKDYICCKASEIDQNLTKILMKFSRS